MIYIVEGPDRTGKNSQILLLKKWLESKDRTPHVLHYSNVKCPDIKAASERYYRQMFDFCQFAIKNDYDLILNRAHIGEVVYSPIYRDYDGSYVYSLEKEFLKPTTPIALLLFIDDPDNLISREDGNSFSNDLEKKTIEVSAFVEAFERSKIKNKKVFDIDGLCIDDVWFEVKSFLEALTNYA
jgi:thymidylate kinase